MNGREILLLYVTVAFMSNILGFPRKIPIGGLFDGDEMIQKAFEISVKSVNRNMTGSDRLKGLLLKPRTEKVNKNAFQVEKIACELVNNGVTGLFGPQDKTTASHIQSMCDILDIPHIAARWDSEPKRGNVINLYPHPDALSMVFQDLIIEYKWKEYAILYDNVDGLIRINRLLKLSNMNTISAMVFHLGSGPNFRQAMKEVRMSGCKNIIIDCSYDILATVLKQALQVGIISENYRVIIASLDLQTLDLEPYQYSGVNLTGIRLIDPESSIVRRTLNSRSLNWNLADGSHLRVEAALAYDAVQLFASGYTRFRDSVKKYGDVKKLSCNRTEIWGHGFSLSNYIRNEQIYGLSGVIKFDTAGFRSEFQLDVVNLGNEGLYKVGRWETNFGFQWKPGYRIPWIDDKKSLRDKHFLVLISLTQPYGMLKESSSILIGNDRYEGFAIDIIQHISEMLGFNYTFEVQIDKAYGSFNNVTKKWDGMLGKIIDNKADLAITDLTITAARGNVVDFTNPFMNLGISVLYMKPSRAPPGLLSFLGPFSTDIWVHVIGVYIIVSALLYVIGKLCPVEWTNPYPCIREPEVLETPYTLIDTPFLVIGAILKSPTGLAPKGISTRTLAVAWWFFTLIIVTMYIANLAAALSTKAVVWSFQTAEELAHQQEIKYGAKINGSTFSFFQDSTYEPYEIMYNYMKTHADEVLMKSNEDGLWKVQHENYAYLMESSSIEYITQRHCNVTQIGGLLDSKGYGIAMRKDVSYRTDLSGAILRLQENGIIGELQNKWWKQKRGGDVCDEVAKVQVEPLNFEDVGGVFAIMISGVALSWIFAGWSFLWNIRNVANRHDVPFTEELIEELKFLIKCSNKKNIKRRKKSVGTIESSSS
ncbi:PREDICTED: glutamate receptor ionotropic, kainate 2-like isoform X2 [Wasmannia auropunctata]|uniref:glutamate receptor ionotropic, kainate 2-like isoform X2 n=1 Tax=Wasmannia auropunctata TaxID=64793 RepID=UPI0005EE5F96|nr:PREDICTED: glutamate receptor ionotropic, kainate 2-like isoform X2 [Wasmannia auropunctata]